MCIRDRSYGLLSYLTPGKDDGASLCGVGVERGVRAGKETVNYTYAEDKVCLFTSLSRLPLETTDAIKQIFTNAFLEF